MRRYLAEIAIVLAIIVAIGQGLLVRDVRTFVGNSRDDRIRFQAEEQFILCSRDPGQTILPDRRVEIAEVCAGYETLALALATEKDR